MTTSPLAEALDMNRLTVYEGYLDEELDHQQSQVLLDVAAGPLGQASRDR
ncbi:MAG TPA: hypothetical protein VI094_01905 [Propionibacteriaceae bacterium]